MRDAKLLTDRFLILVSLLMATALPLMGVPFAHAAGPLISRYDKLSNANPSAIAIHEVGFTPTNTSVPVGSFSLEFCSNDPLPNTPCTAPSGFNASARTLIDQSGETGFTIEPSSTANKIIMTRPASIPTGVPAQYHFGNIVNPDFQGSFYIRLQTYTSTDATGADVEAAGIALSTSNDFKVQTEVPPYLVLCAAVTITATDCSTASSFLIDFGEFSSSTTSKATSNILIATNAASGFSLSVSGTTLTSGNNILPGLLPGGSSSVGTSQFGVNLRANSNPSIGTNPQGGSPIIAAPYNVPNTFRFQNGDVLASSGSPTDYSLLTVSYIANISKGQAPGYYATTLTYICLANF